MIPKVIKAGIGDITGIVLLPLSHSKVLNLTRSKTERKFGSGYVREGSYYPTCYYPTSNQLEPATF